MKRAILHSAIAVCAIVAGVTGLSSGKSQAADLEVSELVAAAEQQRIDAVARAIQSAVSVFSSNGGGGGSGVVISADGYALSNFHVTSPVGHFMKCGMSDGALYDAVIVGIDPTGDVALIKLFGRKDFVAAEYGDSNDVKVGDWCFAVGNPFLLATDFQPTVTYGIVSGVHRYQYPAGSLLEYADCIQTDAAINPGNSGGPLFNSAGQLIGINGRGSFEKRGRVNVGLGYAISINQIRNFLGHLKSGRIVDHATLGATVTSDGANRVVVSNILESSDAFRRGLRYGDEIVAFGGRTIDSVNAFKSVLGIFPRGWRVPLSFIHENQRHNVHVRLAGVHAPEELLRQLRPGKQQGQPEVPKNPNPDAPDEQPERAPPHATAAAIPDHLASHYEARTGYANFVFNAQNQDRIWKAFSSRGDFSEQQGKWTLKGRTRDEQPIHLELTDSASEGVFGQNAVSINAESDLSEQLVPQGSGGLLVAIHLWRRMLVRGPMGFGDVFYLGTSPLPPRQDGLFDTFVATHDVLETFYYFDQVTGSLIALEMYPKADVDPCRITFEEYREVAGRQLPHRMTVDFGDEEVADIELLEIEYSDEVNSKT